MTLPTPLLVSHMIIFQINYFPWKPSLQVYSEGRQTKTVIHHITVKAVKKILFILNFLTSLYLIIATFMKKGIVHRFRDINWKYLSQDNIYVNAKICLVLCPSMIKLMMWVYTCWFSELLCSEEYIWEEYIYQRKNVDG